MVWYSIDCCVDYYKSVSHSEDIYLEVLARATLFLTRILLVKETKNYLRQAQAAVPHFLFPILMGRCKVAVEDDVFALLPRARGWKFQWMRE